MTQPVQEPTEPRGQAAADYRIRQLARRPGFKPGGGAIYEIKVFEDVNLVVAGDNKFIWEIPEDLDAATIMAIEGFITTEASSTTQIQVRNETQGNTDVLSTKVTIDTGDLNSRDAAVQPVVIPATTVNWGDHLCIDVDAAGAGGKGLGMIVVLAPAALSVVNFQGTKGDPGGVTSFQGPWSSGTTYQAGDIVTNNNVTYLVTEDHTSDAASEPGVGVDWEDFITELIDLPDLSSAFEVVMNGNEFPLDIGVQAYMEVPYDCEIVSATLLANIAGSLVVDIWRDTYGAFQPTNADSITAAATPTISGGIKSQDTTLAGWTTALTEGDILAFNIDSCSVITKATLSLKVERPV